MKFQNYERKIVIFNLAKKYPKVVLLQTKGYTIIALGFS